MTKMTKTNLIATIKTRNPQTGKYIRADYDVYEDDSHNRAVRMDDTYISLMLLLRHGRKVKVFKREA